MSAWFFTLKADLSGRNYTCLMEGIVCELREPDLVFLSDPEWSEEFQQYTTTVYETAESAINNLPVKYLGGSEIKTIWIDEY